MEVSPTGQGGPPVVANPNDPVALLQAILTLTSQNNQLQQQIVDLQRQQLELVRENTQIARDQRARQIADLERWQQGHAKVLDHCKDTLGRLEQVHAALMGEMADYVEEHHDNLVDGDFALSDFVDRFGPRLAHLNTMLAVLRPLALAQKKPEA